MGIFQWNVRTSLCTSYYCLYSAWQTFWNESNDWKINAAYWVSSFFFAQHINMYKHRVNLFFLRLYVEQKSQNDAYHLYMIYYVILRITARCLTNKCELQTLRWSLKIIGCLKIFIPVYYVLYKRCCPAVYRMTIIVKSFGPRVTMYNDIEDANLCITI